MIARERHGARIRRLLAAFPVVAIVGARQVGKSTLAREVGASMEGSVRAFDLESDRDAALLASAEAILSPLRGVVVIDEVQRLPSIFPTLRPLADRKPLKARFLLLGSASPELTTRGSESLAGRIVFHELGGLNMLETGSGAWRKLWLRGGYPKSYTAKSDAASLEWRDAFIQTYLERDVLGVDMRMPPAELRRYWQMLAHWHGQRWSAAEFARAFGVSESTSRRWLDALEGLFAVRLLQPWYVSVAKRQVRAPKVYIRDSGMLHALLAVRDSSDLRVRPQVGASFEGFVIDQVIQITGAGRAECFHWATHQGAELDLLLVRGNRSIGFEVKCTEAPTLTKSMQIAVSDLGLERLYVIHQGTDRFELAPRIEAVPVEQLPELEHLLDRAPRTRRSLP
jgi:predicted AAA+ superfamily ATPase